MKYPTLLLALIAAPAMYAAAVEPATDSTYSLELGATANMATTDITRGMATDGLKVDTYGVDLTAVRRFGRTKRHAFTLRFGYAEGSGSDAVVVGEDLYEVEGKLRSFSLMPGYRYTRTIYGKLGAFAGANVGIICHNAEDSERWGDEMWVDVRDYAFGLSYSLECGFTWQSSPHLSYFVAYQFSGSTAQPKLEWSNEDITYTTRLNAQRYHSIRCGLSYSF